MKKNTYYIRVRIDIPRRCASKKIMKYAVPEAAMTDDVVKHLCSVLDKSDDIASNTSLVVSNGGKEIELDVNDVPAMMQKTWNDSMHKTSSSSLEDIYFILKPKQLQRESSFKLDDDEKIQPMHDTDDLVKLSELNEEILLQELEARFHFRNIYTYVGQILITVNPFRFMPIYNPKYVAMYRGKKFSDLPPHIFAIADSAYNGMRQTGRSYVIVISGESGSGKTESTKLLVHHLTYLSDTRNDITKDSSSVLSNPIPEKRVNEYGNLSSYSVSIKERILQASPILEAFGNACTARNSNSSRFGKFIELHFKESGTLDGARILNYLLEKSRIVCQAKYERNYHVFYYMLKGATDSELRELNLVGGVDHFNYLRMSSRTPLQDDGENLTQLRTSLRVIGLEDDSQNVLLRVLAAILHLGNMQFISNGEDNDRTVIANMLPLSIVASLLEVEQSHLLEALTVRKSITRGEIFTTPLSLAQAVDSRDAMAKAIYGELFNFLVRRLNRVLQPGRGTGTRRRHHVPSSGTSIGVLDIFGFEDFKQNSFEQLCINFANETLQQYFNSHIFLLEQEEYADEAIQWSSIAFVDNQGCLDLIAKKPTGLLHLLDEECNFPKASDESLLQKFHSQNADNEFYEKPRMTSPSFVIVHYAGKVNYLIADFLEKNRDSLRAETVETLRSSRLDFVCNLFRSSNSSALLWSRLRGLVRCISYFRAHGRDVVLARANDKGKKVNMVKTMISKTLNKSAFVVINGIGENDSLNVRHHRPSRPALCIHNGCLSQRRNSAKREISGTVGAQFHSSLGALLATLSSSDPFFVRCIKSNTNAVPYEFDREFVLKQLRYSGMLETVRIRQLGYSVRMLFTVFALKCAILLPRVAQASPEDAKVAVIDFLNSSPLDKSQFQVGRTKVFLRQSSMEHVERLLIEHMSSASQLIQRYYRARLARLHFLELRRASIILQSGWRGRQERVAINRIRMNSWAAHVICRWVRMVNDRNAFLRKRSAVIRMQRLCRARWDRHLYISIRSAVIGMQSRIRGLLVRHYVTNILFTRTIAAIKIQAAVRGFIERRNFNKLLVSIIKIQSLVRGWLARRTYNSFDGVRTNIFGNVSRVRLPEKSIAKKVNERINGKEPATTGYKIDVVVDTMPKQKKISLKESCNDKTSSCIDVIAEKRDRPRRPPRRFASTTVVTTHSPKLDNSPRPTRVLGARNRKIDIPGDLGPPPLPPGRLPVSPRRKLRTAPEPEPDMSTPLKSNNASNRRPLSCLVTSSKVPPKHVSHVRCASSDDRPKNAELLHCPNFAHPFVDEVECSSPYKADSPLKLLSPKESSKLPVCATKKYGILQRNQKKKADKSLPPFNVIITSVTVLDAIRKAILDQISTLMKGHVLFQDEGLNDLYRNSLQQYYHIYLCDFAQSLRNKSKKIEYPSEKLVLSFYNTLFAIMRFREVSFTNDSLNSCQSQFRALIYPVLKLLPPKPQKPVKSKKPRHKGKDKVISWAGHEFVATHYNMPTFCEVCHGMLWGIGKQGYTCTLCSFTCHPKCHDKVLDDCGVGSTCKDVSTRGAFSMSLIEQAQIEDRDVPLIVELCTKEIEERGFMNCGIYRISGSLSASKSLKQRLNEDMSKVHLAQEEVNNIASTFKMYLRELEEPLMTFAFYDDWIAAASIESLEECEDAIYVVARRLPPVHYASLEMIIFHLAKISQHEQVNKMSPKNLGIVFGPTLMRPPPDASPLTAMNNVGKQSKVVEVLIGALQRKISSTCTEITALDLTLEQKEKEFICARFIEMDQVNLENGEHFDKIEDDSSSNDDDITPEPQGNAPSIPREMPKPLVASSVVDSVLPRIKAMKGDDADQDDGRRLSQRISKQMKQLENEKSALYAGMSDLNPVKSDMGMDAKRAVTLMLSNTSKAEDQDSALIESESPISFDTAVYTSNLCHVTKKRPARPKFLRRLPSRHCTSFETKLC